MAHYFLGNRQMGGFVSAMSYSATTYSAFMLIGLAGLTYAGGVGALGFELIYLCGVTLVLDVINDGVRGKARQSGMGLKLAAGALAWPALLRKAYRLDPGFAT